MIVALCRGDLITMYTCTAHVYTISLRIMFYSEDNMAATSQTIEFGFTVKARQSKNAKLLNCLLVDFAVHEVQFYYSFDYSL